MSAQAGEDRQKSPEEIREEIETTRADLGDTVEALAAKADVKAQAKDRITSIKDAVQHKKDVVFSRAREGTPDSAGAGAEQVVSTVKRRPTPFIALGAFVGGVLVGRMLARR